MELCSGAEVAKNKRYDFERFQMAKIENSLIDWGRIAETFSFFSRIVRFPGLISKASVFLKRAQAYLIEGSKKPLSMYENVSFSFLIVWIIIFLFLMNYSNWPQIFKGEFSVFFSRILECLLIILFGIPCQIAGLFFSCRFAYLLKLVTFVE